MFFTYDSYVIPLVVYKTRDTTVTAEEHRKDLKIKSKYAVPGDLRQSIDLQPCVSDLEDLEVPTDLKLNESVKDITDPSNLKPSDYTEDPSIPPVTKVKKVTKETKTAYSGENCTKEPQKVTVTTIEEEISSKEPKKGSGDIFIEDLEKELIKERNYVRIRGLLSELNEAMYHYASNLTKGIIRGKSYLRRLGECNIKYKKLIIEFKAISQDKIKLQEELDDLSSKFSAMKNTLAKVSDINEDNRQLIDKLRANRDQCLQASTSKMKTVNSLRSQTAELRRKLSHFRKNK